MPDMLLHAHFAYLCTFTYVLYTTRTNSSVILATNIDLRTLGIRNMHAIHDVRVHAYFACVLLCAYFGERTFAVRIFT